LLLGAMAVGSGRALYSSLKIILALFHRENRAGGGFGAAANQ
jgi:hypothetical protein